MSANRENRSIFVKQWTPADINKLHLNSICSYIGIDFTERGANHLSARMPVDQRTTQPVGILHGGASVVLAETLGSVAAWLCLEDGANAVGLDINANHIRAVTSGWVHGTAKPVHIGRTTQVWQIDIVDDQQKMVCCSRITMAVVPSRRDPKFEPG